MPVLVGTPCSLLAQNTEFPFICQVNWGVQQHRPSQLSLLCFYQNQQPCISQLCLSVLCIINVTTNKDALLYGGQFPSHLKVLDRCRMVASECNDSVILRPAVYCWAAAICHTRNPEYESLTTFNFNKNPTRCNSMQICIYCEVTLHVSGVTAPIIRSTKNCNRSLRYGS